MTKLQPRLHGVRDVAIIGQGNVALDCARLLLRSPDELESTDIVPTVLDEIRKSEVQNVHIFGRRSHVQASFTIKELREVTKLANVRTYVSEGEIAAGSTRENSIELAASRPLKRLTDLISSQTCMETNASFSNGVEYEKNISLRFLLSPKRILSDSTGSGVGAIEFERTVIPVLSLLDISILLIPRSYL